MAERLSAIRGGAMDPTGGRSPRREAHQGVHPQFRYERLSASAKPSNFAGKRRFCGCGHTSEAGTRGHFSPRHRAQGGPL